MKYPIMKISHYFLEQKHIKELQSLNLLYQYESMLITLESHSFKFLHERKNFMEDLSKVVKVDIAELKQIINVLVKHNIFVYKYEKVAYFNEKHLYYDNGKCVYNNNSSDNEQTWDSLMKELE